MPVTPLHFGPALLLRKVIGTKYFYLPAFAITQILFDIEPLIIMTFYPDDFKNWHPVLHTTSYGISFALAAIGMTFAYSRIGSIVAAVFGSVSHLWLDALYHTEVAENLARWGNFASAREAGNTAEIICLLSFLLWFLLLGIRKVLNYRSKKIID